MSSSEVLKDGGSHLKDLRKVANLAKRVKKGDVEAFSRLYDLYFPQVYYSVFRYLGNHEDAAEATQDVFIKTYQNIDSLQNEKTFNRWINQIAYNHSMNMIDKRKRKAKHVDTQQIEHLKEEVVEEHEEFIPQKYIDAQEGRQQVLDLMDCLNENQRAALILYYFDGLSVAEIAEATSAKENTVRKRLFDARAFLKEKLGADRKMGTIAPGAVAFSGLSRILTSDARTVVPLHEKAQIKEAIFGALGLGGVSAVGVAGATVTTTKLIIATLATAVVITGGAVGYNAVAHSRVPVDVAPQDTTAPQTFLSSVNEVIWTTQPAKPAMRQVPVQQAEPAVVEPVAPQEAPDPQKKIVLGTPTLQVSNPHLTYDAGARVPLDRILADADIFAVDSIGRTITPTVSGYGAIDFSAAGEYALQIGATDSEGNQAGPATILVSVQL